MRERFLFMNPGNGIETSKEKEKPYPELRFLFMNPGNGIETIQSSPTWGYHSKVSYL